MTAVRPLAGGGAQDVNFDAIAQGAQANDITTSTIAIGQGAGL